MGTTKHEILKSIVDGTNDKFEVIKEKVYCKCGHAAVWWRTDFVCGTITAYPCYYTMDGRYMPRIISAN